MSLPHDNGLLKSPNEVFRTGREMLRDLWSFESENEEVESITDEGYLRPSLQSSVSSARSSSTVDENERRMFVSIENGISNLDVVDFSFGNGNTTIVQQGWLVKRGHNWQTWKRRWFCLTSDGKFEYFKKQNLKKSKGKVDLNDGIVHIQFADVHRVEHTYAFFILKGFYQLLCSCETASEADLWVQNLRQVRLHRPTEYEGLNQHFGNFPSEKDMQLLLNKDGAGLTSQMLRFQRRVLSSTSGYSPVTASSILAVQSSGTQFEAFSAGTILQFVHQLEQLILTNHKAHFGIASTIDVPLHVTLGIRCVLEDRIYLPLQDTFYKHMDNIHATRVQQHIVTLRTLPSSRIFDSSVLNGDVDWTEAIATFSALDTASLPTHKLHIFQRVVDILPPTLSASALAFRYICVHSTLENVSTQAACLRLVQKHLPMPGLDASIAALISAITWIANFNPRTATIPSTSAALISVVFSTPELGIQFIPNIAHQERGARVVGIQKNSQANWSAAVQPGLVLIAVNDLPVAMWTLLDIVAYIRQAPLPKRLVFLPESEVDTFSTIDFYYYMLCGAAHRGDFNTLRYILERCPSLNLHEPCLWRPDMLLHNGPSAHNGLLAPEETLPDTPIHAAVEGGHIDLVRFLLDDLALNPNQYSAYLSQPLHMLTTNITEIAPLLVSRGAQVDAFDQDGRTPLLVQCHAGSKEGVITLVGLGSSLRAVSWMTGMTPLLQCVSIGHLALVDFLLLKGASVKDVTNDKDSVLHLAASCGHVELIHRLIQAGASILQPNRLGCIPAMVLLQHHKSLPKEYFFECFRALTADRTTMQCCDVFGRYIVHFATSLEPKVMKEVMEWCLEKGANGHVEDIFGDSAKEYRKHPKEHGEYVPPTSYMRHLHVSLVELESKFIRIQNGKIEDIFSYLLADKSTNVSEMVSFLLNFQTYIDLTDIFGLFKSKYGQHDAKYTLKHAWSVVAGGSFLRDHHCGGLMFLSLLGVLYPHVVNMDGYIECAQLVQGLMSSVHQYIQKFQLYFNTGFPSMLYKDLYQHMVEMYANKHNDRSISMARLALNITPFDFAKQCTLLAHALFSRIPIRQLMQPKCQDIGFLSARHWFQHVSTLVTNYILLEDSPTERARVISFFLDVAEICFISLQNFDTFIAIVYALQSTPIFRLKISFSHLTREYTEKLHKAQTYTQSGSREMNRVMKSISPPCMPYLGLYLQNIVGLNELPKYEEDSFVNFNRLRMLGKMAQDLMRYQAVSYPFHSQHAIEEILHVMLPYPKDEDWYNRSHALETKEAIESYQEDQMQRRQHADSIDSIRDSLGSSPATSWTSRLRINSTARRERRPSSSASQV